MGAGSLQEMGEERSGGGIPKVYRVVRGWEPGSKGGRKSTGDGRREVRRWYSQGVQGSQGVGTWE